MASLVLLPIVFTENGIKIIRFLGLGSHNWAQQRKVGAHAHSKAESNGTAIESAPEAWPHGHARQPNIRLERQRQGSTVIPHVTEHCIETVRRRSVHKVVVSVCARPGIPPILCVGNKVDLVVQCQDQQMLAGRRQVNVTEIKCKSAIFFSLKLAIFFSFRWSWRTWIWLTCNELLCHFPIILEHRTKTIQLAMPQSRNSFAT